MNVPLVIDTEGLAAAPRAWLAERVELVTCNRGDPGFSDLLLRAQGLVVRTYTLVDAALLSAAPQLRVVGRAGVGLDNVDVTACRAAGVEVVYTPDANSGAVSELVFALLLDALRPREDVRGGMDSAAWAAARMRVQASRELADLTLGIWGFGRVGKRIARIARGFSMNVLYHDLLPMPLEERHGAVPVPSDVLMRAADIVTLHVSGEAANHHLIDAAVLSWLKPDAILVNTSRGFVVDPTALAAHLARHPAFRAILDVHVPEPVSATSPLLGLANVRMTPHIGASTGPAKERMSWVVRDVWRVLSGEAPESPAPTTPSASSES